MEIINKKMTDKEREQIKGIPVEGGAPAELGINLPDVRQVNFNNLSDESLVELVEKYTTVYERDSKRGGGYMTTIRREDLPQLENYLQRVVFRGMAMGDTRAMELSNRIKSIIDKDGGNLLSNPLGFGR